MKLKNNVLNKLMIDNETWKGLGIVIGTVIGALTPKILDLLKKSHLLLANESTIRNAENQRIIDDIRARHDIDRIVIAQFSNGISTLNGVPFINGRLTFESKKSNLKSILTEYANFPVSWFASLFAPLVTPAVKSVLWSNDHEGHSVNFGKEFIKDTSGTICLKSGRVCQLLMINFTDNFGNGVLELINYNDPIELTEDEYKTLLGDVFTLWRNLKVK